MNHETETEDQMTYEEFIRAGAEKHDAVVTEERGGLRLTLPNGASAWHRLGGIAESMYNRRLDNGYPFPGRWGAWDKQGGEEWRAGTAFEVPSPAPLRITHPEAVPA